MNGSRSENGSLPQFSAQILYSVLGSCTIVTNFIILFVLIKNIKYALQKFAFIFGLAGADFFVGLASVSAAAYRIIVLKEAREDFSVHPLFCMKRISTLGMIASQITPIMFFVIGSERLLAVTCFRWYYKTWTNRKAWFLTLFAYTFCFVSVIICWIIVSTFPTHFETTMMCIISRVVGVPYALFLDVLAIFGGTWALLTSFICLILFFTQRKHIRDECSMNMNAAIH